MTTPHTTTAMPTSQRFCLSLLVGMMLCLWATLSSARGAEDLSQPEVAVEVAGDSLDDRPEFKWYSPESDAYRPAQVKPPRQPMQINPDLAEVLLWLGLALLAALLLYVVFLIVRSMLKQEVAERLVIERGPAGGDIARVEELPVNLAKSPEDYLSEAERLYRRGDYSQAIVYLFSHQLLQLDRRHLVRLVKGKTNRQYLRETRRSAAPAASEIASLFEQTVLVFEEVFFGKRLPPQAQIDAVWQAIPRFEQLVEAAQERAA